MTLEIAAIVKNAGYFDDAVFTPAIKKKMARILDAGATHTAPAEGKMICARTFDHDLRPFLRARPLGICADIVQRLRDECFVP